MRRGVLIVILALLLSVFAAACTDDLPSNQAGCKAPEDVTGAIYTAQDGCLYGSVLDHYADEGHEEEVEGEHEAEGESHDEEETHEDAEAVEAEETEAEEAESEE